MSGHSKWHNIRVKKMASDAKRGKIYTRHAKLIQIAAQKGGDPVTNASLRVAIDNAKAENVPNANIERAIQKGTGELKGQAMEEVMYAAFGPGDTAYLIECHSDNRNRTLSNVKYAIGKNGGHFAETNAVAWMFERKGVVSAKWPAFAPAGATAGWSDEYELALIDAGAENIDVDEDTVTVTSDLAKWVQVRETLMQAGAEILSAGLRYVPTQKAEVKDAETAGKVAAFIEALEEDEDVSDVHTNADIAPDVAGKL